jgi:hypothetical protein
MEPIYFQCAISCGLDWSSPRWLRFFAGSRGLGAMTAETIFLRVSARYNGLITQLLGPRVEVASPRHRCTFRPMPRDANRIGMICLLRSIGKSSINSPAKSRLSPIRTRAPLPERSQARTTFGDIEWQFVLTG